MAEGEEGQPKTGRIVRGSAHASISSSATARGTVIRGSGASGEQAWSVEFGQWQIEAADAEHKRAEEHKENELRRFILRCYPESERRW
jgi:hypothetical protein